MQFISLLKLVTYVALELFKVNHFACRVLHRQIEDGIIVIIRNKESFEFICVLLPRSACYPAMFRHLKYVTDSMYRYNIIMFPMMAMVTMREQFV